MKHSVKMNIGGLFFVCGHGGTEKTFLWKTIIAKLCSDGKIVVAVASSGIASLLIEGGRTTHSRFKIPLNIDENSRCDNIIKAEYNARRTNSFQIFNLKRMYINNIVYYNYNIVITT